MEAAVGAFLLSGVLIVLAAAFQPLGRLIERIPTSIAAAMLAGVLVRFTTEVFASAQGEPALVLPLVAIFLLMRVVNPSLAVLAVLATGLAASFGLGLTGPLPERAALSSLTLITPVFDATALIGLGIPLFLVTMASQNLPGFAVLRASGYAPPTRSILAVTGLSSMVTALFGAHTSNLAAISAAICTGPDTHPDPGKRWMTGPFYALCYLLLAAFGAFVIAVIAALPASLIKAVAGLALMGALVGALGSALADDTKRFPAVLAFVVTASGLTLMGVGSAFWGLAAGLLAWGLDIGAQRWRDRSAL
jgi:benzoate membrane transport protein